MATLYYAHYDIGTLLLLGYYNSAGSIPIPFPTRELTEEQWKAALDIQANQFDNNVDFNLVNIPIPNTPTQEVAALNSQCSQYIAGTEYFIDRFNETAVAIPANVMATRLKCYTQLGTITLPTHNLIDALP